MHTTEYDAIVVGSGPNGLAAAIAMQREGLSVLLVEGKEELGGGCRSKEYNPGFIHDICSAIHPLAADSAFFKQLPLAQYGLEWIYPEFEMAHPFDDGHAAVLKRSIPDTASTMGVDKSAYQKLFEGITRDWPAFSKDILGPFQFPSNPLKFTPFGLNALLSSDILVKRFNGPYAKGLFAGLAAHSMMPLSSVTTAAIGLVLGIIGHRVGWPLPKGGSQSIVNALQAHFVALGGKIQTGFKVTALSQLPSSKAVLFDVTPRQLLQIAGHKFSTVYKWQLKRFLYGTGVFKIDFELNGPVPFTNVNCQRAGTVHLGGTYKEIAEGEEGIHKGLISKTPFVLAAQQSRFDASRAPAGKHTFWTYCHVPLGNNTDMTAAIENQVERFAPGFKDIIIDKHTLSPSQVEQYNPNYIGGDINGGRQSVSQLFTRPALRWSPYKTSAKGLYICSSSTPPGGGVHGICGYYAAREALKDVFSIQIPKL